MSSPREPGDVNLPPHGKAPKPEPSPLLPCSQCQKPTHRATLAMFGARCLTCFEAYCRNPARAPEANP